MFVGQVSGHNGTHGKLGVGQVKSDVLMGTEECLLPPSHVGYKQSFVSRIELFVLNLFSPVYLLSL